MYSGCMTKKIGLTLALGLLAAVGLAAPATAAPSEWADIYFYDDFGNHVGTRWVNCNPPYVVTEGTVTLNRVTVDSGPC